MGLHIGSLKVRREAFTRVFPMPTAIWFLSPKSLFHCPHLNFPPLSLCNFTFFSGLTFASKWTLSLRIDRESSWKERGGKKIENVQQVPNLSDARASSLQRLWL